MTDIEKKQLENKLNAYTSQLEANKKLLEKLPGQITDLEKQIAEINEKLK